MNIKINSEASCVFIHVYWQEGRPVRQSNIIYSNHGQKMDRFVVSLDRRQAKNFCPENANGLEWINIAEYVYIDTCIYDWSRGRHIHIYKIRMVRIYIHIYDTYRLPTHRHGAPRKYFLWSLLILKLKFCHMLLLDHAMQQRVNGTFSYHSPEPSLHCTTVARNRYHIYGSLWTAQNIRTNNLIPENILSFHQFNRPSVSSWTVNCFDVYANQVWEYVLCRQYIGL